uniref:Uncharacterized protein n=1 Tax=Anguilla anguilla TaxID=7936 RepID=A0A0E9VYW3_ANGAN
MKLKVVCKRGRWRYFLVNWYYEGGSPSAPWARKDALVKKGSLMKR